MVVENTAAMHEQIKSGVERATVAVVSVCILVWVSVCVSSVPLMIAGWTV